MPLRDDYLESLDTPRGDIRRLLQHARVAQADVLIEKYSSKPEQRTSQQRTFYENEEEARGGDGENDGTVIYAIGSLTKLLIAMLISIMVDKLPYSNEPEDKPYLRLQKSDLDPWNMIFTDLFNIFSDRKMSPLPHNPTLRHVLLHFNSLPPMNSILLAPDGKSIMSVEEFLEVAPRLSQDGNKIEYSNGNYILVGLLIQAIAPKQETLQTLMEKYIFGPLGMNNTYMSRSDLGDTPCARPHVVSANGRRALVSPPGYPDGALVIPAMGAFSCTMDIALLLRSFLVGLDGDDSRFNEKFVLHLLQPEGKLDRTGNDRQTLCGIQTTLDTSTPGSKSINRLITPTKVYSTYRLGLRNGKEVAHVPAFYMTGAIHGYASCFYLIPKHHTFVVVLSNTSGRIDASDHISRLILQEIFDLERPALQLARLGTKLLDKDSGLQKSDLNPKVDILNMSSRAAQEGQNIFDEWERADTQGDMPGAVHLKLDGTYQNELTHQSIVIRRHGTHFVANIFGNAGTSGDIGIHRTGLFTFRLYPLDQDGFTIDRYELSGWKELSFTVNVREDGDGIQRVVGIERNGDLLPFTSRYRRM